MDRRGFALTALAVAALVVGMESLGAGEPRWAVAGTGLALAAVLLGAAVLHLLRSPRPLVDLRTLRIATFRVTAFGESISRAVITAILFLLPLFFQPGSGWTAAEAGVAVIALSCGTWASSR